MKIQRELINKINLDFKREVMTEEEYYNIKTNHIVDSILSQYSKNQFKRIVIENYKNKIDEYLLTCLSAVVAQILNIELLVIGDYSKTKKYFTKFGANIKCSKRNKLTEEEAKESFFLSPRSSYNLFNIDYCFCGYFKTDYYPFEGLLISDIYNIARNYYSYPANLLAKERVRLCNNKNDGINYFVLSEYLKGFNLYFDEKKYYDEFRDDSSPLSFNIPRATIICPLFTQRQKIIDFINNHPHCNVLFLQEDYEEALDDVSYFWNIIKVQNTPLLNFNIFKYDNEERGYINVANERIEDCTFNDVIFFKKGKEDRPRWESLINDLKIKAKVKMREFN